MADIQDIVRLLITVQDRVASTPNFGRVLIAAHEPGVGQAQVYQYNLSTGAEDMLDDGFIAGNPAHRMVQAMAAQSPNSLDVLVYSRPAPLAQSVTFTPLVTTAGARFELTLDGVLLEYVAQVGDTATDIATAISALADALPNVTSTDNTGSFTLTPSGTSVKVAIGGYSPRLMSLSDDTPDASLAADLDAAVALTNESFYGVATDANDATNIAAVGAWAEAAGVLSLHTAIDSDNLTADTGVGAALRDLGLHYAVTMFSTAPGNYPVLGLASRQLSINPGASTWALKPLQNVPADELSAGQLAVLRANRLITYTTTNGVSHTLDGFAASGRFVDLTRGVDWLDAEVENSVFNFKLNQEKVPYTVAGISAIRGAIMAALLRGARRGVIDADSIEVTMPSLDEISQADRGLRQLCDIRFTARAQGAIHLTKIEGVVRV